MNKTLKSTIKEITRTLKTYLTAVHHSAAGEDTYINGHLYCDQIDQKATIETYTRAAWACAQVALWGNVVFSIEERERARQYIGSWLIKQPDIYQAYIEFCERVLLTRQYISQHSARYVPVPSLWLDPANKHGFNGTLKWHRQLLDRRRSSPLHRLHWKALAEAILDMVESTDREHYQYWCNYFTERSLPQTLALFRQSVAEAVTAFSKPFTES